MASRSSGQRASSTSKLATTVRERRASPMSTTSANGVQRNHSTSDAPEPPPPKKNKPAPPSDEVTQDIIEARYWRTRFQLYEQRDKAKSELEESLAKLEAIEKAKAEDERRLASYKELASSIAQCRAALVWISIQMLPLQDLNRAKPKLCDELDRCTKLINHFLIAFLPADECVVGIPKTAAEQETLAASIAVLHRDLERLSAAIGSKDASGQQSDHSSPSTSTAAVVEYFLKASGLLVEALSHYSGNESLMQQAETRKVKEDFLKSYTEQLKRLENFGI